MGWRLNIQAVYEPRPDYMGFPGRDVLPCWEFDELGELVAFLRDIGRLSDGLDEYADRVKREGEIMARVAGSPALKGSAAIDKAVRTAIRRELPPAEVGITSE